jgi:hypothetical protein
MNQIENEKSEEQELTKKERNNLKREKKQKERENRIRIKKIKNIVSWAVFIGAIAGGVYWISVITEKINEARPGEAVPVMGADHIENGERFESYNSNPPTSGPHGGPAEWGFSAEEIADENAVHNLEHGGIWISYKNLDDESVSILEEIARRNKTSVIVSPRESNDSNIAVASWGRLMKLDAVDEELINEFIKRNKNKSPEPIAI